MRGGSMSEIQAIRATAAARRAAGEPCNPMRDPLTDDDWMTEPEIQRVHVLGLEMELARIRAVCWEPA